MSTNYGPLHAGALFNGVQRSGRSTYPVEIRILDVGQDVLCGELKIKLLTSNLPELTTYFEGEIIGRRYSFQTRKWGANDRDDSDHWSRWPEYRRLKNNGSIRDGRLLDRGGDREELFMRWKELNVVNNEEQNIHGASFAGFYYICLEFDASPPISPPLLPTPSLPSRHMLPRLTRRSNSLISAPRGRNITSTSNPMNRSQSDPLTPLPTTTATVPASASLTVGTGTTAGRRRRRRSSYAEVVVRGISPFNLATSSRSNTGSTSDDSAINDSFSDDDSEFGSLSPSSAVSSSQSVASSSSSSATSDGSRETGKDRRGGGPRLAHAVSIPLPFQAKDDEFPFPTSPPLHQGYRARRRHSGITNERGGNEGVTVRNEGAESKVEGLNLTLGMTRGDRDRSSIPVRSTSSDDTKKVDARGSKSWSRAKITGFYFHASNSQPYQELSLDYISQHRGGSQAFEFC